MLDAVTNKVRRARFFYARKKNESALITQSTDVPDVRPIHTGRQWKLFSREQLSKSRAEFRMGLEYVIREEDVDESRLKRHFLMSR